MKKSKYIQEQVKSTFNTIDAIEEVNVPPFFKDKVLQRLMSKEEEKSQLFSWFSPRLQLATLVCVVALNVMAFMQLNKNSYDSNISAFAETYGLANESNEDISLFN